MFFSFSFINNAYEGLIKLDPRTGKSRKEKTSGLRYLLATSQLLRQENRSEIDLGVRSEFRQQFIDAVGNVVALNDQGLFSADFAKDIQTRQDHSVGSNFLTTPLRNSRDRNSLYPGRPGPLLKLNSEYASIHPDVKENLINLYHVNRISSELCIWLLRNEDFGPLTDILTPEELLLLLTSKLSDIYTPEVVSVISPSVEELTTYISTFSLPWFTDKKPDYSDIVSVPETLEVEELLSAKVLENDLADNDKVFNIVDQLLSRGAKGIIFSGPPGTSKTWYALKVAIKIIDGGKERLERVQFHPSFTYEDFIEGLVSVGSANGNEPMFEPKDKVFLNLCTNARSDPDNLYILIIDEFSRGDPSKIFGELLTYIEPDYRDIAFRLPYSEKEVSIPQNIVIFATMNPYDKSVVDLDSAMERRFEVIELLPSEDILKTLLQKGGIQEELLGKVIEFFNKADELSPHGFGHTYFKGVLEEIDFILLWNHKLKFIFKKMFRFKDDAYTEVRQSYINIISEQNKDDIE